MYSTSRAFIWPPPEDNGSASSSSSSRASHPPLRRSHHAPPPPPPPGQYRPAEEYHASDVQQQSPQYGADTDLSAVRAFINVNGEDMAARAAASEAADGIRKQQQLDAAKASSHKPTDGLGAKRFNVDAVMFDTEGNIVDDGGAIDDDPAENDDDNDLEMDNDTAMATGDVAEALPAAGGEDGGLIADPGAPAPTTAETESPMPPPPSGTLHISREAMLKAANLHARKYGYALSIKKSTASGQKVVITCTREGKPMNSHRLTEETRVRRGRVSKRSGCRMKIAGNRLKVRRMVSDGQGGQRLATEAEGGPEAEVWRLRVITSEHNHGPDDEAKMNPIHRKMSDDVKAAIAARLSKGMKVVAIWEELVGLWPGLTATQQDVRNEVARMRKAKRDLDPNDPQAARLTPRMSADELRRAQQLAQQAHDEGRVNGQQESARQGLDQLIDREPPRVNAQGRVLAHAHPTEQERSALAVLKAELESVKEENRILKESGGVQERDRGVESRARAELRRENDRLRDEADTLKRELDQAQRDIEAARKAEKDAKTRLDELRAMFLAMGNAQSASAAPPQPQPPQPQPPQQQQPFQAQAQQYPSQHQQFQTVNVNGAVGPASAGAYAGSYGPPPAPQRQPSGHGHAHAGARQGIMAGLGGGQDWRR